MEINLFCEGCKISITNSSDNVLNKLYDCEYCNKKFCVNFMY